MPNKKTKRRRKAKAASSSGGGAANRGILSRVHTATNPAPYLAELLLGTRSGMPQNVIRNPVDYSSRIPAFSVTQSPPRNLRNQIYWFQKSITYANALSISATGYTEQNVQFTLATMLPSEYTAFISLFDQYCIHTIVIHINVTNSLLNFSGSAGRLTTAIDYDNIANLGTEVAVQEFSTSQTVEVSQGTCVERVIRPCVDMTIYQASSSGYGPTRVWLDSASPSVPHYGLRTFWINNSYASGGGLLADYLITSIIGFRQSI